MEQENEMLSAYTIVFDHLDHLGPGDSSTTRNLVKRLRSHLPSEARVGDFGCGVGASAIVLAQSLPKAHVLALDSHAAFEREIDVFDCTGDEVALSFFLARRNSAPVGQK